MHISQYFITCHIIKLNILRIAFKKRETYLSVLKINKKVQVRNGQEMAQSERNSHSTNRGLGKQTTIALRYSYITKKRYQRKPFCENVCLYLKENAHEAVD